jgi:hypothetical protein
VTEEPAIWRKPVDHGAQDRWQEAALPQGEITKLPRSLREKATNDLELGIRRNRNVERGRSTDIYTSRSGGKGVKR